MKTTNHSNCRQAPGNSTVTRADCPDNLPQIVRLEQTESIVPKVSRTGSRAETAVYATLGIVGIVAIIVALVSASVPAGSKEAPLAALGKLPVVHYVLSGQLIADARTAAAMMRYFFDSDKPMGTNATEAGPTQKNLAMPTNNAAGAPKA